MIQIVNAQIYESFTFLTKGAEIGENGLFPKKMRWKYLPKSVYWEAEQMR